MIILHLTIEVNEYFDYSVSLFFVKVISKLNSILIDFLYKILKPSMALLFFH